MAKYLPKKNKVPAQGAANQALKRYRKRIYWQAGLALLTVILTITIVFAMTAAWYTNIVQTSGLVFEAEAWGFDGEVVVNTDPIQAAPGDEGVIHLEVKNNSENISALSVNISKARMADPEMQKRLYFFVDTQLTREGETMNRVYLNNQDSYTYTIFNKGNLTLTENMHNDAQLKWQWVYDVLGYYVLGKPGENGAMTIVEYLRPIEYNYDDATTTFESYQEEEGKDPILTMALKTVDGITSVDDFLVELSKTDGYPGEIDPDRKLYNGYYPVQVDADGYGIYAYLCSYAEIEMATQYDTKLGNAAAKAAADPEDDILPKKYEAKLTISAQKSKTNIVPVSSLSALETAINAGIGDVIQLTSSITIADGKTLTIPTGSRVMLDLNGNTITSQSATTAAITAQPGSALTLVNGKLVGMNSKNNGIDVVGAEVTISNVDMENVKRGLNISDSNTNNTDSLDSKVRMVGCDIKATDVAIFLAGNGTDSEQTSQLVIEDCKIEAEYYGISGNGTVADDGGRWGTDIQLINSTINATAEASVGIYHPQKDSYLTIYNSTVTGHTAVVIKGGHAKVVSSTVIGKGAVYDPKPEDVENSGFLDTGDGVYIETNYGYEITLEISEDKTLPESERKTMLTADHARGLRVFEETAPNVSVKIHAGEFKETPNNAYIAPTSILEGVVVRVKETKGE